MNADIDQHETRDARPSNGSSTAEEIPDPTDVPLATEPPISAEFDASVGAGLFGYIDSVERGGITGWLVDAADPAQPMQVDAYLDGLLVSSAQTGTERADLGAIVAKAQFCGFYLPWYRKLLAQRLLGLDDSGRLPLQVFQRGEKRSIGPEIVLNVGDLRKWLASLPADAERFSGRLHAVSPFRLSGYALDRMNPSAPVVVDILIRGELVGSVLADQERGDLEGQVKRPKCGFEWSIPREFRDGQSWEIEVKVRGEDYVLAGSGATVNFAERQSKQGAAQRTRALALRPGPVWVSGWVIDEGVSEPLAIELFVDGHRVGKAFAGQYGPDLESNPDYPFKNVHTRFTFPTPKRALDGRTHEFRLRVEAWGSEQPENARVRWAAGDYFGHLNGCQGGRVSGWIAFHQEPDSRRLSAPVEIYVDGQPVGQCFLIEQSSELAKKTGSKFAYIFRGDLGCKLDGEVSAIYAGVELARAPENAQRQQKLTGRLDGIDRISITGWAVDLGRPTDKVELELVSDGYVIAVFRTNEARPDVCKALRLPLANVGYALPTPRLLLDGQKHNVAVRFASNKTLLRSDVASFQFQGNFRTLPCADPHPVLSDFISRDRRPLALASGHTPIVSIVILNRNGQDVLEALLRSFVATNSLARYEFIVVDHASKDASVSILEKWTARGVPITVVPLPFNGSFSASNNLAIKEYAKGEYVLLLNNDIVFVQDVLPELVRTLQENPRVGLVGIKLLDVVEDRGRSVYPPIQHLGIRYAYAGTQGILPYDEKLAPNTASEAFHPVSPAGVTGALMLCRRSEYLAIGGLHEAYFYGYEDVDICLKYRELNKQDVICRNDLQVLHHRGYSRLSGREMGVFESLGRNHEVLMRRWGYAIQNLYRRSLVCGDRVYSSERLRIAFAVTEIGADAVAGDYFTALELARALAAEFDYVEPVFLSERDNWFDLDRIHVLVVMRHDYDLRSIVNARPDLVKVAWLRNHFESWLHQHWFDGFDIYLSAAPQFAMALRGKGYQCEIFPIATNLEAMTGGEPDMALRGAVGFNGSAWAVKRKVLEVFEELSGVAATTIVGRGWEGSSIEGSYKGRLPYERMRDFYASVDIVVDDANESASRWGSANSRVFDALGAGTLVITNSAAASEDLFDGLLPVWNDAGQASALIRQYTQDPTARRALAQELRAIVEARHTYKRRAAGLLATLQSFAANAFRIAIKVGVPTAAEKNWWGDWHFAEGLKRALKALGHSVHIDLLCEWRKPSPSDDLVIVLRGLSEYTPDPTQLNLLWILSHPDEVSLAECNKFDHVFSASEAHVAHLRSLGVAASALLQCTDPERMRPVPPDPSKRHQHLFVGNSRGQPRKLVSDLVSIGVEVSIFGREWQGLAPDYLVKGELIDNEELATYYGNAGVVYNDHWPDMSRWGFLSNRLFDAAACGAYTVSDKIDGLDQVFGGLINSYESLTELAQLSSPAAIGRWNAARAHALRNLILTRHTFADRAKAILAKADELRELRLRGSQTVRETAGSEIAGAPSATRVA